MCRSLRLVGGAVALAGCGGHEREVRVSVDTSAPAAEVSERFLSVAVDTAMVVGGTFWDPTGGMGATGDHPVPPYDFARPRLRALAAALAPAYLRIGGTDADKTHIDLSDTPATTPPAGYKWILTRAEWDGAVAFAEDLGYQIVVTLDAGEGPRVNGAWRPDDALPLVRLVAERHDPVALWELGNEVNVYPILLGLSVPASQYAADLATARAMLAQELPGARLAGPASAYWPKVGEVVSYVSDTLAAGGSSLDVVTWHYYPQESRRCPMAVVRATAEGTLDPARLDDVRPWAEQVIAARDHAVPRAEVWLGETGSAQCGGEPGVSDAFAATFWWLDELGLLARRGHRIVVRQSLTGSTYGLLEEGTLNPNPDYWASVLWKRLMGSRVLSVQSGDPLVRAYAHCAPSGGGATLVAVYLGSDGAIEVRLPSDGRVFVATAPSLDSRSLELNGVTLEALSDGT